MGCTPSKQSLPAPQHSTASTSLPQNSSSSSLPATRFVIIAKPNRVAVNDLNILHYYSSQLSGSTNNQPAEYEHASRSNEQGEALRGEARTASGQEVVRGGGRG